MRPTIRLMFSEREDAERVLKNGFTDNVFHFKEALAVAKYYRHINGWGNVRIKKNLIIFCKKSIGFRYSPKRQIFYTILSLSKRDFEDTTSPIHITRSEYDVIRSIKNYKFQVILLGLFVISKLNKRDYAKLSEWKHIRKIISRYITNKDIRACITFCYNNGYIGETRKNDMHCMLFMNNNDVPFISIRNNKELFSVGKTYETSCGGKLGFCRICEEEFIKESNYQRYCKKHQREKELESKRKWKNRLGR